MPPARELQVLYRAARSGDIRGVRAEAARLAQLAPDYAPWAERVLALADEFDDLAIAALIEPHLTETDGA